MPCPLFTFTNVLLLQKTAQILKCTKWYRNIIEFTEWNENITDVTKWYDNIGAVKDTCSTGAAGAVALYPLPMGARFALLNEDAWVLFLYFIYNKCPQTCLFQPFEDPNIKNFPLGPAMVGPLIMKEYLIQLKFLEVMLLSKPSSLTPLINSHGKLMRHFRKNSDY